MHLFLSTYVEMQYDCNCAHLSLQGVSVGTNGAIAMAEALMINQSLHTLE